MAVRLAIVAIAAGATSYLVMPIHVATARARVDDILRSIRDRYSEPPLVTFRRMGTSGQRLREFLSNLKREVNGAVCNAQDRVEQGDAAGVRGILDRLRSASLVLGLWHAGRTIDGIAGQDATMTASGLREVTSIADEQIAYASAKLDLPELAP